MHSWRVLLLPFIEQKALYERYDMDEPWDGPSNGRLIRELIYVYRCPSEQHNGPEFTNYVLVTGPGTPWADGRAPRYDDFTDGLDCTILVVEVADSNIAWSEPRDLTFQQALHGINATRTYGISAWHPLRGAHEKQELVNVAMVDSTIKQLKNDFSIDTLRKLLQHQDGEPAVPIR